MAAIGRKLISTGAIVFLSAFPAFGDRAADMRSEIGQVATALTAGNPAEAIAPFDKSFANYQKLRDDFEGLTNAFQLVNEVDVVDERDTENETELTLNWTITMTDPATNYTESRSAELSVRLARNGRKWKIVDLSPIGLFNPQQQRKSRASPQ